MDRRVVYLDNNGTTRMADEVVAFMHENDDLYGNASSMHTLGREAAAGIEWARGEVASLISAESDDKETIKATSIIRIPARTVSRLSAAFTSKAPRPGSAKIDSTAADPPKNAAADCPVRMISIGKDGFVAHLKAISRLENPRDA